MTQCCPFRQAKRVADSHPDSRAAQEGSTKSLQVSVDLTLLDVTVHDHAGKPVRELEQRLFKVYEDKVEQTINFLGKEEEGSVLNSERAIDVNIRRTPRRVRTIFRLMHVYTEL